MCGWSGRALSVARRVVRATRFARSQGLARLVEEKGLKPRDRGRRALARRRWRRANPIPPGAAVPVWVVGLQRSGTNMLVRALGSAPEVEVCSENDRRVFRDFRVRSDHHLAAVVRQSRHRLVVFKPLSDAHRVTTWLEGAALGPGRAIWMVRSVDGRTRSALAKFGPAGLDALRDIAAGRGEDRWQAQGLSAESRRLLGRLDLERMTPASGAAVLWYLRNSLYFELGLEHRADVQLLRYEDLVAEPVPTLQGLCRFIGLSFRPSLAAGIQVRSPASRVRLDIDPEVRALCDDLGHRLRCAHEAQRATP